MHNRINFKNNPILYYYSPNNIFINYYQKSNILKIEQHQDLRIEITELLLLTTKWTQQYRWLRRDHKTMNMPTQIYLWVAHLGNQPIKWLNRTKSAYAHTICVYRDTADCPIWIIKRIYAQRSMRRWGERWEWTS